jgi:uncharacterized membrane protein
MHLDYLAIILRWLHILSAAATVGGTLLIRTALLPSAMDLPEEARRKILDGVRARWSKIVHLAILLLLVTGFANFFLYGMRLFPSGTVESKLYNALFGVKFLLAIGVFGLAEVLLGRSSTAEKMRLKAKLWNSVALVLLVLIVCISGVMSRMHTRPNEAVQAPVAAVATP